jgi:hypothetical protein
MKYRELLVELQKFTSEELNHEVILHDEYYDEVHYANKVGVLPSNHSNVITPCLIESEDEHEDG